MNTKLLKSKDSKRFVVCPVCHSPCVKDDGEYYCTSCAYSTTGKPRPIHKLRGNRKDTNENSDKEQISLAMGSQEYKERQKDLFENSARKEDDAFHVELEQRNELQASDKQAVVDKQREKTAVSVRKYRLEQKKRSEFKDIKHRGAQLASLTETKRDDRAVARMTPKGLEDIVYNEGVSEDEYLPSALSRYM